jgi:hypothetical protein
MGKKRKRYHVEFDIDIQTEAARQRDDEKRTAIIVAGHEGKRVIQAKKSTVTARPTDADDET